MLDRLGKYRWLKYLGVFGIFTNFLTVAAYYCYIESWTLAYVFHSIVGTFRTTDPKTFFPDYLGVHADSLFAVPLQALFWFLLTLALNVWILSKGLAKGIETAAKIGMPLLILFGIVLAVRGLTLGTSAPGVVQSPLEGLNFVWNPNMSGLTNPSTWLAAAGQIFFTLSTISGSRYPEAYNDAASAAHRKHPRRFIGMAMLPMQAPDLALKELERAATLPGLRGLYLATHVLDKELDDPSFFPVYARCEELGWPIFLHPMDPIGGPRFRRFYLINLLGNPYDSGIAAAHLIFGGVMDRFPRLHVMLPHAGGTFPALVGRWDHGARLRAELKHMTQPPSSYLRRFSYDSHRPQRPDRLQA